MAEVDPRRFWYQASPHYIDEASGAVTPETWAISFERLYQYIRQLGIDTYESALASFADEDRWSLYGPSGKQARAYALDLESQAKQALPGVQFTGIDRFAIEAATDYVAQNEGAGYRAATNDEAVAFDIYSRFLNQPSLVAARGGTLVDLYSDPRVQESIKVGEQRAQQRWAMSEAQGRASDRDQLNFALLSLSTLTGGIMSMAGFALREFFKAPPPADPVLPVPQLPTPGHATGVNAVVDAATAPTAFALPNETIAAQSQIQPSEERAQRREKVQEGYSPVVASENRSPLLAVAVLGLSLFLFAR